MENYVCDSKDDKEIELKECYAEKDQQQEQGNINCAQILQIAQMIQQKAETLQTERQHLEFLQFKVQDLKKEYALQLEMNDKVKYNLFKELRTVYGLEMRSIKRKEENVGKRRRIEQCIHTIQRLKEEKDAFRKKNKIHQELYFPHLANINICQRTLERKIHTIQDEQESRDNELNFLTSERYRNLSQVNELQHEGKDIQSDRRFIDPRQHRGNFEMKHMLM